MCSAKLFLAMIFNEIKCHVNTSLGLMGGMHPPLYPRLLSGNAFCFKKPNNRIAHIKCYTQSKRHTYCYKLQGCGVGGFWVESDS